MPGPDRVWKETWRNADQLPRAIRVMVRDAATERILSVSTATTVHVELPAQCVNAQQLAGCTGQQQEQPPPEGRRRRQDRYHGRHQPDADVPMSDPFRTTARRRSSDGFIVVAVLWILGALATLATIYSIYVINTATALAVNDDRLKSEALVSAGVELAAHQLSAAPGNPAAWELQLPARGSHYRRGVPFRICARRSQHGLQGAPGRTICIPRCAARGGRWLCRSHRRLA